jgi:hypothetical protein
LEEDKTKMPELRWEMLETNGPDFRVYRCPVPGGWLVALTVFASFHGAGGLTFVPDPDYEWDGSSSWE